MRPSLATSLAIVLGLAAALGEANAARRLKFRHLTPRVRQHLAAPVRANVDAVVRYDPAGLATGVVVARPSERTALVLTNYHSVEASPQSSVVLAGGHEAPIRRVVASREKLDYALVEVVLPEGAAARPVRLEGGRLEAGAHVYAVSASTNPLALTSSLRRTTARGWHRSVRDAAATRAMRTIQTGHEIGGGRNFLVPVEREDSPGRPVFTWSLAFRLPNAPGMSGSPVFSARTHKLVALHWGGNHDPNGWQATGVPIRRILHDLGLRLRKGDIDEDLRVPLKSLLDAAARD